jgi:hypothetical protein
MSKFRSNLNSINNNVLKFARHNNTHSNDALATLLTNIYTSTPAAIIVETGVNYRSATSDFQAWAIYYNPENIYNPAAPDNLELISQYQPENNYAYTGTFEIFNQADLGGATPGNFFCLTAVDYQAPGVYDVITNGLNTLADVLNDIAINNFNNTGVADITIIWENTGVIKKTTFSPLPTSSAQYMAVSSGGTPVECSVMVWKGGGTITGDAIPAHTTTGRYGILLNQYTII